MKSTVKMVVLSVQMGLSAAFAGIVETEKWQSAIDAASSSGGGIVVVPEGRHVTGGLFLRDNVTLKLEKGAVLEGSVDPADYVGLDLEFVETRTPWSALIMATNAVNVSVIGEGRIFGNGTAFPPTRESVGRPRGLIFYHCRNVRIEGVTIHDPGSWTCYFKECDGVVARNVTIDSHSNRNNDGFDIDSRNVLIENCTVDGGDDGICLKSDNPSFTVENVVVRGCTVSSTCNALKIGTGSHGNFRNILFENYRKYTLNTYAIGNTANGEGFRNTGTVLCNNGAFKSLHSFFVSFANLNLNANGIADRELGDVLLELAFASS